MNLSSPSGPHSGHNFSYAYENFWCITFSHFLFFNFFFITASDRLERGSRSGVQGSWEGVGRKLVLWEKALGNQKTDEEIRAAFLL